MMPSHSDLWALLTIISFDQISVMGYKSSGNHYHADDNENLKKRWSTEVAQLLLVNYSHTKSHQLEFITSLYTGFFVAMCMRPFNLGAGLVNHFDLPFPYATIVPSMVTPWSKTQLEPSSVEEERKTKVVYRKDDTTTSIFLRIVSDNLSFDPQADYCNIEGRKKCFKRGSLEVLTLRLVIK